MTLSYQSEITKSSKPWNIAEKEIRNLISDKGSEKVIKTISQELDGHIRVSQDSMTQEIKSFYFFIT